MNRSARYGVLIFELLSGGAIRRCMRRIHKASQELRGLSDEEVIAACREMVEGPKLGRQDSASSLLPQFLGADLDKRDAEALALAAEAFSRFPPKGFERGARLFEHQLLTAAHLLRGTLVQMDTGEGKTFALWAAALALLRSHPKVYIISANPYLAARDAVNCFPIWNALGISVGQAVREGDEGSPPWRAQVVYTTLDDLLARSLREDLGEVEQTLKWSALLIDEADAILLEKSPESIRIIRNTDDPTKDWSEPLRIAAALVEEDVERGAGMDLSATLTAQGEAHVAALMGDGELRPIDRLLLLRAVELAYVAIRMAREGHDYEIRDRAVVPIDPNTGWHTPHRRSTWVGPLEASRGLPPQPHYVVRHFGDGITLLRRFSHIAGASGTIIEEALEYVMLLRLPPAVVPPRRPRQEGRLPEVVTLTREIAHEIVEAEVAEHGSRRPILIAASSTIEAQEVAERLIVSPYVQGVHVRPVTDETIAAEQVFESAGRPGVTIVSTRLAGRGVDIRLSPAAREAGGAMLLVLGHSLEARVDRQLLGRVGREGEPYSARFINYPEDPLMREIAPERIKSILRNWAPGETLDANTFKRVLAGAQRTVRRQRLQIFAYAVSEGQTHGKAITMLHEWRQRLGVKGEGRLTPGFVCFLADRLLATRYPALSFAGPTSLATVTAIADDLVEVVQRPNGEARELAGKCIGQSLPDARQQFARYLEEVLRQAAVANEKRRKEFNERQKAADRAAAEARALEFLRALDRSRPDDVATALRLALVTSADAAVPVSIDAAETTVAGVRQDLSGDEGEGGLLGRVEAGTLATSSRAPEPPPYDSSWTSWVRRSSWSIASETIDQASQQMETGLRRTRFRVGQTAGAKFMSAYQTEVEDLKREVEANLVSEACSNVIKGAEPAALDDLFVSLEHQVEVDEPKIGLALPTLPAPDPDAIPAPALPVSSTAEGLIVEYAEAMRERYDKIPDEDALTESLKFVMNASELSTLVDVDRVARAYSSWKRSDKRKTEIPPWRWRIADRYVRGYFAFLHERGLVAPLPSGLPQRSRSLLRRAWKRAASPGSALAFSGIAAAALLGVVLALAPPMSEGFGAGPGPELVDRLLTGGTFFAGLALGPLLLALFLGLWARLLLGLSLAKDAGVVPIERQTAIFVLVVSSFVLVRPWGQGLSLGLVSSIAGAIAVAAAGAIACNNLYRFEQMTHYHVLELMAAGLAAFSALPFLVRVGETKDVLLLAGACALVLAGTRPWRHARIRVLALGIEDTPSGPDSLEVALPVTGRLSVVPHAFALAFAWALSCGINDLSVAQRSVAAAGVYLAMLGFWAHQQSRSVTDPEDWRERMRGREQSYEPIGKAETLADALADARRRIFTREMIVVAPLVVLAGMLGLAAPSDLAARLPLGVATLCVSALIVDFGIAFLQGLRSPLPGTSEPLSGGLVDEAEGAAAKVRGLVAHYTKRLGFALLILVAVKELLELASLGEFVAHLFQSLADLL
ncbi:MAG TPA: DEAD/DEAH box helicase [Solirubrobacterales bacterium]|nr:DEAD/DEAH box helicase [Solirubrobacterales bacterium]